jgi:hypothetical protein
MSPVAALILAIITGVIATVIGHGKGHPVWGFFLGFLLSVIGIIIIACAKPNRDILARREAARLSVQEEAHRRVEAERVPRTAGLYQDHRPGLIAAYRQVLQEGHDGSVQDPYPTPPEDQWPQEGRI